ncbi:unnamed protein product [Mytilus coruscus]|uniref:Endonuclease/exonuclease/phosphatase domain-containing protein n=1 Tax=Mytilus coruscus TaxID=42192 RepID=A0A6J8C0A1_MYTCO|nr:unnamed protein product [Mytilus coruscus]
MDQHAVTDIKIKRRCKQIMENYEERVSSLEKTIENKCDEERVIETIREEVSICNEEMVKAIVKEEVSKLESPGSPSIRTQDFIRQLNALNTEVCSKCYSHILIMGDFNFPEINWDIWNSPGDIMESNEYKFLENLQEFFLFQHIAKPTRWRDTNTPHTIDLILTNEEQMISNLEYQSPLGKSDHCNMKFDFN